MNLKQHVELTESAREKKFSELQARVKELEDVLRWLLHLYNGVSKGGWSVDKDDAEWDDAWDAAYKVMTKEGE